MGIFDKIKNWGKVKIASLIFGITTVSVVYFVVSSIARAINSISRSQQATDCDAFKYKVLNFVNIICLVFLACVSLPSNFSTLMEKYKIMQN
jgi:hypothetical protein